MPKYLQVSKVIFLKDLKDLKENLMDSYLIAYANKSPLAIRYLDINHKTIKLTEEM